MMQFSTKSEILSQLKPLLKKAHILPQVRFTVEEWQEKSEAILDRIKKAAWSSDPLVVRSSAIQEDGIGESKAGEYESVLNVQGENDLKRAIKTVIDSFEDSSRDNQVFIQPMLKDIGLSGVAFSKDPSSSAPYFILNYDDFSGSTDSVTGGSTNELKTFIHYKYATIPPPKPLDRIISLIQELESLFSVDALDVEFAITKKGELFLFQVRPLVLKVKSPIETGQIQSAIQNMERKLCEISSPHPYLHGSKGVYGVMPDWNPAEIIGIRPKPLALSLYKEIITDSIWAYQRDNYGYRNLRSFPLMLTFYGIPFIDVRVSFNSFIPHDLPSVLAERLVNYYISRLEQYPNFHDKVEFEIIYSCYTLDLPERLQTLDAYGFNPSDRALLSESLRKLTNRIIDPDSGLWKRDLEKIEELKIRFNTLTQSSMEPISKIYWLIEDCKRYGTLPFAGLARAGFIAIQLLKSLVATGILTSVEYASFLASLNTISSELAFDFHDLPKKDFLRKYGHLRPGTYDVLSPRYDEAPDLYFNWDDAEQKNHAKKVEFSLTLTQMKQIESHLKQHKLNHNVITFFEFLKSAIEGREYAKFYFTQNLSSILSQIAKLCAEEGIEKADSPFLNFSVFKKLYGSSEDCRSNLMQSIEEGKRSYEITKQVLLPPLITDPGQVWSFHLPLSEPNFITLKTALGPVAHLSMEKKNLEKSILFIPSADPGFDWIFSHQIAGFVTMYGGVNSHMAIRSAELQIPAVIGAGEALFREWSRAKILEIDAGSKQVKIIR